MAPLKKATCALKPTSRATRSSFRAATESLPSRVTRSSRVARSQSSNNIPPQTASQDVPLPQPTEVPRSTRTKIHENIILKRPPKPSNPLEEANQEVVVPQQTDKPTESNAEPPSSANPDISSECDETIKCASVTASQKQKETDKIPPKTIIPIVRSGYGDGHASRESQQMASHAKLLGTHGVIDAETETMLSKPWHKSGVLDVKHTPEHLAKLNPNFAQDAEEIMDLQKAQAAQRRKDAQEKKFLENWKAGKIDAWGHKIPSPEEEIVESSEAVDETASEEGSEKSKKNAKENVEKVNKRKQPAEDDEDTHTVPPKKQKTSNRSEESNDGKVKSSSTKMDDSTQLPTSQQQASSALAIILEKPAKIAPAIKKKPNVENAAGPSKFITSSNPPSKKTAAKTGILPLQPGPNRPDYSEYNYGQCVAMIRERNIYGAGGVQIVRNRLIQDDLAVDNDWPRDAKSGGDCSKSRTYKNAAPIVPGAPQVGPAVYATEFTKRQNMGLKANELPGMTAKEASEYGFIKQEDDAGVAKSSQSSSLKKRKASSQDHAKEDTEKKGKKQKVDDEKSSQNSSSKTTEKSGGDGSNSQGPSSKKRKAAPQDDAQGGTEKKSKKKKVDDNKNSQDASSKTAKAGDGDGSNSQATSMKKRKAASQKDEEDKPERKSKRQRVLAKKET